MVKIRTKIKIKRHIGKVKNRVTQVLERRLDAVMQTLYKELQQTLSKPGPSSPGEPPGITKLAHSERVPGGLMKSIGWTRDGRLKRRIGTPLERGYWLEMGVGGGKIIRPTKAKALLVPVPNHVVQQLQNRKRSKTGGGRGGMLGLIQRSNGHWFMLKSFVIQGPIAPRPWLKPTMIKHLRHIGKTLGHRIV